jgi:amidohydrolase
VSSAALVREAISARSDDLLALSHQIAARPELAFEEHHAAEAVANVLRGAGFQATIGTDGLDTAVRAEAGDGPLAVAFLAEYDALPEIGHACGHNVVAAAAVGAAVGLAAVAGALGIRVVLLGTPAEEGGGGKILLLERGAFEGIHAALMVHPGPRDFIEMPSLATTELTATFTGRAAHASAFPERGVNAADAATLAQVAIGLLRQQLRPEDRVHGIVTEAGVAPNVIPDRARMRYLVRSARLEVLGDLEDRVKRCFRAAAMASGCTLEVRRTMPAYAELRTDPDLAERYRVRAGELGRTVREPSERARRAAGSTDMGNVSQRLPAIHPMIGVDSLPDVPHQPGFASVCAGPRGDRAVLDGATALALTAADAASLEPLRRRLLGDAT